MAVERLLLETGDRLLLETGDALLLESSTAATGGPWSYYAQQHARGGDMAGFLRQATAAQVRALGPFLDDTDFKTPETALTIANTDIKLVANGGASANKNSGGGTHRVNGEYGVTFDATDTATVGALDVSVVVAGALPVFTTFTVLEEAVYDALFVAAAPGYGVAQTGDSFARLGAAGAGLTALGDTRLANLDATITSRTKPADTQARVTLVDTLTAYTGNTPQTGDTYALANGASGFVALKAVVDAISTTIGAAGAGLTATASAVWGVATRVLTAGTNIVLAKGTGITGFNDLSAAQVNTEADTALSDVGLTTTITGRIDAAMTTRASQTSVDDLPTNAELATALGTADDAVLAAIAALNNLSQANVRAAVGLATANLDTQLDALPTNAELATALASADDAVLAAIAALNNLSAAQVNAEVLDVIQTDTHAEVASVPAANASLALKIGWMFLLARNKITQTATTQLVRNDADSATVGTSVISDDATTFVRGEYT